MTIVEHRIVNYAELKRIGRDLLIALGEDPEREGLKDTPRRWASMWKEFIEYTPGSTETFFASVSTDQMVVVSNMRVFSYCVPSRQEVNAVDGTKRACDVQVGDRLWTLHNGEAKETTVTAISSHKTHDVVEVTTEKGSFKVTSDHPLATPQGWVEAKDTNGMCIEWTPSRALHRNRYVPILGHAFGYVVGAMCADGTVGERYISLIVNEEWFARKFVDALVTGFGVQAKIEQISRPSTFLGKDVDGYRVRVVSSYLADLFRQYVGGDANHMRQEFPLVVLNDIETFQGFIDGYVDGDGWVSKHSNGVCVASGNSAFLQTLAKLVGARFTPKSDKASVLYIADSWQKKHGFAQQSHTTTLLESEWVKVLSVTPCIEGQKPYTVYSFTCDPYPTFLVGGHLTHNCEHHITPFWCDISIGYIAREKVLGLSKFARIAHKFAHRLQLQERLCHQIADEIELLAASEDVAVLAQGEHLCMVSRGIKTSGKMTTSIMRGLFRENSEARMEFLRLVEVGHK